MFKRSVHLALSKAKSQKKSHRRGGQTGSQDGSVHFGGGSGPGRNSLMPGVLSMSSLTPMNLLKKAKAIGKDISGGGGGDDDAEAQGVSQDELDALREEARGATFDDMRLGLRGYLGKRRPKDALSKASGLVSTPNVWQVSLL